MKEYGRQARMMKLTGKSEKPAGRLAAQRGRFGEGFPPRSIAIVGVSRRDDSIAVGYTGLRLLRSLKKAEFEGPIYPINPYASEIEGCKVYARVTDLPERPDLVTITVPAEIVPQVLEDCAAAGVKNVQICTSGFGETGQEQGKMLDAMVCEIAEREGLNVVGPNCMGFHVPSVRMRMFEDVPILEGPVAFLSQSGGHARIFLILGPEMGIGFSKVISYGNALLMDATDFLPYLAEDRETGIICLYLEGVQDGRSLIRMTAEINRTKPVVIWKGGLTSSGARAAASHTGSLAGDRLVWEAFFKQTGAIRVGSVEEMAEVCLALTHLKPSAGKRVAVLGAGGGSSVATGDTCAEEGLEMPLLSADTRARLLEFISLVNQGVMNPLDIPSVVMDFRNLKKAIDLLDADPVVDFVILNLGAEFFSGLIVPTLGQFKEAVAGSRKPVVIAVSNEGQVRDTEKYSRVLREAGLLAFPSLQKACRAMRRFAGYHEFLAGG